MLIEPGLRSTLTEEAYVHASTMQVVDENGNVYQNFKLGEPFVFFMEYERDPSGLGVFVEFFAGYDGDKAPDFNFNFASEIQNDAVEYLGMIEGEGKTFCAGSKRRFPYSIAESLAANYCSEHNIRLMPDEKERIKDRLSSVLMSNGRFPEKILIVPDGKEIFDFSPVGYSERSQIKET